MQIEFGYRDSGNVKLPFELTVKLREAKKARIISKRDKFGRILSANVLEYADTKVISLTNDKSSSSRF